MGKVEGIFFEEMMRVLPLFSLGLLWATFFVIGYRAKALDLKIKVEPKEPEPTAPDGLEDDQEPKKCAKEGEHCCHAIQDGVSGLNRSVIEDMIKEDKEDKEGEWSFEEWSEWCKKRDIPDCCEGYYCAVSRYSSCRNLDGPFIW